MVTIVNEDRTYPFIVNQSFLEKFLRNQQVPEEILQSLTVVMKSYPEHFWNILWLPDGEYFEDEKCVFVYTNWIAEDVHWEAFRDRHERLPFSGFFWPCLPFIVSFLPPIANQSSLIG